MHWKSSTSIAAVQHAGVAAKPAIASEGLLDVMDIIVEECISLKALSNSVYLYPPCGERQWIPTTTIEASIHPFHTTALTQETSFENTPLNSVPTTSPTTMYPWPGGRGYWQGQPRGFRGQNDDSFIGRRGAMENHWNPYSRVDMSSPADFARDYYGGRWGGSAGRGRHAAMQQQFMGLQPGAYNRYRSRMPPGGFR